MNPGFAQLIAAVSAGVCRRIRHVRVTESVDVSLFAADSNMDELGWGLPRDSPGHAEAVRGAVAVFEDALDVLAELFGVVLEGRRCTVDFAYATSDLDLPGRPIRSGHVAGLDVRWEGIVDDRAVVELHQRWVMGSQIDPTWSVEHGYVVEIDGEPKIRTTLEIWPHHEDLSALTLDDIHGIGMMITALPAVNATLPPSPAEPATPPRAGPWVRGARPPPVVPVVNMRFPGVLRRRSGFPGPRSDSDDGGRILGHAGRQGRDRHGNESRRRRRHLAAAVARGRDRGRVLPQ